MSQYTVKSILIHYSHLFMLCKFMGLYPHNLQVFQQYRELKKSTIGTVGVVFAMILIIVLYNLLIFSFSGADTTIKITQSK